MPHETTKRGCIFPKDINIHIKFLKTKFILPALSYLNTGFVTPYSSHYVFFTVTDSLLI